MNQETSLPTELAVPVGQRDHIRGHLEAPFQLVEYADFECPLCAEAHQTFLVLQERMGAKLCLVFRHFPLMNKHPHALLAAQAAEAASVQGRFWKMHDLLFENQEALEDEDLVEYATSLGLDVSRFTRDLENDRHLGRVQEHIEGATASGVTGTPVYFINGVRYEGKDDPDSLTAALTADR